MRSWFGRRKGSKDHPGLRHVDNLLSGHPDELEVPISGLPDQIDELFSIYQDLFELRDYRVMTVDRSLDDLWTARIERTNR